MNQEKKFDAIVIGAGPAGMMAAGTAAKQGLRVLLVEKKERPGKKLAITGKGRCNVTNQCPWEEVITAIPTNGRFLYGALSRFSPEDTMTFFEGLGVPLKTERGNRVFPQSDRAQDIVEALVRFNQNAGVHFLFDTRVSAVLQDGERVRGIRTADGEEYLADKVLIACGGSSYPGTGSNGDGVRLAAKLGHTITPLRPSLVALCMEEQEECAGMQGLSLRNCAIQVQDTTKKRMIYDDFGELLFTHFGLSGPVILSASAHMRDMQAGRYEISINLKPGLSPEQLDLRLQRDLLENKNRDFSNSLGGLLPKKMIPVMIERSGIPSNKKCNQITRTEREQLAAVLRDLRFHAKGFRPIEEAIVTSGGVSVREVNPKTMESKRIQGLYFAGEVLDVDAYTGGFNLQIAFSTGYLAAQRIVEETQ